MFFDPNKCRQTWMDTSNFFQSVDRALRAQNHMEQLLDAKEAQKDVENKNNTHQST